VSETATKQIGNVTRHTNSLAVYDIHTGELCRRISKGMIEPVIDIKVVQDIMISAAQDGLIKIWRAVDGDLVKMKLSYRDACALLWLAPPSSPVSSPF
jgi:hypothetical protein